MSSADPERALLHYRILNKLGEGGTLGRSVER